MKTTGGINWHSARATCSAEQGVSSHLVRIDSEAANNHVIMFIRLLLILVHKLISTLLINEIRCTVESRIKQ